MRPLKRIKRIITNLLLAAIIANFMLPIAASAAQQDGKVVRVGWFDSSFCYYGKFGRRYGVDYEYHQKISAYTGWKYEYVEDSWPNLLQKLKDGEIDLLSDVSYKEDREQYMFFSDLPMGTEAYYIYIDAKNREIRADDLSTLNGKKIGVNKGSLQESLLKQWTENNGVFPTLIPLTCSTDEYMEMLIKKEIDGLATIFTFDFKQEVIPVSRIGGSDYFYAVNKNRPDLIKELNTAMAEIQDEDPYFNEKLSKQRIFNKKAKTILTAQQSDWLKEHGEIRIGYRKSYMPFCSTDDSDELTGALKDFLAHAQNSMNNSDLKFRTLPYETTEDALKALNAGEIDCVFPVFLSTYDADQRGIMLTDPVMKTEMNAIMRTSDRQDLSSDSELTFAVNADMLNVESFIMEQYPNSKRKKYNSLQACYDAVANGEADCVLVSNYRIPSEDETLNKNKLFSVPTGESMSFSLAVNKSDRELYAILNKTVLSSNTTEMDATLASYMYSEQKFSFMQFWKKHWLIVVAVLVVFFTFILFLLISKLRAERLASRQKHMLEEAAQISELHQTVSSLLDNMPGLYMTKDATTGKYLACNQAFASFANKKDPSEIVGLTSADIFDQQKSKQFDNDDEMALSMDEPLILYDDLMDAFGNQIKFRITKQKYTDANGKLCVLGIFQDASNNFRVSRDKVSTKESYEKARSSGIIFTHIAQTLARDYTEMFYVNTNTEEFTQYSKSEDVGELTELRRGWHFFSDCKTELSEGAYPDDKETFLSALNRKKLMKTLAHKDTFVMTYRRMISGEPVYFSMKISRMYKDEDYIIIGFMNVDAEIREAIAKKETLSEALSSVEIANRNRATFLAGMSQVVRSPINAIIGLDALALKSQSIDRKSREFLKRIGENAHSLLALINNILEISPIVSGKEILNRSEFSLNDLIEQINGLAEPLCRGKEISFSADILGKKDEL